MNPAFEYIAPANLHPSPSNPRKTFPQEKLEKLAASIRAQGILQPILVRPLPRKLHQESGRQIVIGESRWRAAAIAEIDVIPCVVREMTDDEVLEAQHVENLQRNDLSPLEEAESLRAMLDLRTSDGLPRYTVELLAERFGVERSHIYRRLQLLNLPTKARKALADGILPPRVAVLIGRIPDPGQRAAAAEEIIHPQDKLEPLSFVAASKLIGERYMRGLKGAPFRLDDATLVPEAGPCTTCPKMTDNCAHLFSDDEAKDFAKRKVCCDPSCFLRKVDAVYARQSAAAEAEGKTVLSAAECAKAYPAHVSAGSLAWDSPYVDISQQPTEDLLKPEVEKAPSWKSLIATAEEKTGAKVPRVIARDQGGRVHELVERKLAIAAIEKAGEPIFRTTERAQPKDEDQYAKEKKREQEESAKRLAITFAGLTAAHEALGRTWSPSWLWDALLPVAIDSAGGDGCWLVLKWKGVTADAGAFGKGDAIEMLANDLPESERQALVPLLFLAAPMKWSGIETDHFRDLANGLGLDLTEIKKAGLAALKATKSSNKKKDAKPLQVRPNARGKSLLSQMVITPSPTERPKSVPVTKDESDLLGQMVRAHEGGMSPYRIASEFRTSLEDVCGALELDIAAVKNEWSALCSELAAAWSDAGIAGSFRAQDRIAKSECGLNSATELVWPEHIRKVLAFLNRAKAGAKKQAAPVPAAEEDDDE